jgi:type II secretory pathway pseudopilin PulG
MARRPGERSFTLVETVIALSLLAFLIVEMGGVQGNAIAFAEYGRRVSEASWLAKRLMAEVEYQSSFRPFKELETAVKDQKFEDAPEYSYDLEIQEWKLDIASVLAAALSSRKGADGEASPLASMGEVVKMALEQAIGDEALKMARVTVYWPEGATRNSTSLGMILVNQEKMDSTLAGLKGAWDALQKQESGTAQAQQGGNQAGSNPPPAPPAPPKPANGTTGGGP